MRSSNVPSSRTGLTTARPCSAPSRKSSSPNAIAVCTMPGAVVGGDEVGRQHGVALLAVGLGRDERERRLVARRRRSSRAGEAVGDLGVLAEHALGERLGERPRRPRGARTSSSGSTATAALEASVHGVVVQTSSVSPSRSAPAGRVTGKRT